MSGKLGAIFAYSKSLFEMCGMYASIYLSIYLSIYIYYMTRFPFQHAENLTFAISELKIRSFSLSLSLSLSLSPSVSISRSPLESSRCARTAYLWLCGVVDCAGSVRCLHVVEVCGKILRTCGEMCSKRVVYAHCMHMLA